MRARALNLLPQGIAIGEQLCDLALEILQMSLLFLGILTHAVHLGKPAACRSYVSLLEPQSLGLVRSEGGLVLAATRLGLPLGGFDATA